MNAIAPANVTAAHFWGQPVECCPNRFGNLSRKGLDFQCHACGTVSPGGVTVRLKADNYTFTRRQSQPPS